MPCAKNPTTWMTMIGTMTIGMKTTSIGTTNGTNRKRNKKWPSQIGLIGVIFRHENDEQPWLVQDNRKALKNEFPCQRESRRVGQDCRNPGRHAQSPKQIGPGQ